MNGDGEMQLMTEGKAYVIVVDDDRAVRESLKFALELEGFAVHAFAGGPQLLASPLLAEPFCLVLDHKMPTMNGFDVLARLAERNVSVPVILITSEATDGLRRRAAAAGVHKVLEKPLLGGALARDLHDLVDGRKRT